MGKFPKSTQISPPHVISLEIKYSYYTLGAMERSIPLVASIHIQLHPWMIVDLFSMNNILENVMIPDRLYTKSIIWTIQIYG